MENIYVGLRYVPVFDGDWDNTKSYEPLMIVTYQGNSYTSKTYVPVGAAIDNTSYWALTGNYNAQVEAYRQETQRVSDALALKPYMMKYPTSPNSLPYSTLKTLCGGNDLRLGDFYTNTQSMDIYFVKTLTGNPITAATFEKLVNVTELQNLAATVGNIETTVDRHFASSVLHSLETALDSAAFHLCPCARSYTSVEYVSKIDLLSHYIFL